MKTVFPMNMRVIARMDVKMEFLIKGVQLEGWRKVGDPIERAIEYYQQGADEIIYMDVVASLYERNNLTEIVRNVAEHIFIPITVGGGIGALEAVHDLLAVGADKVAINTAATKRPELLRDVSDRYGSQATVLSIEAKQIGANKWEAMTDNGRNHTYRDVVEWAREGEQNGAGEILLTSIDKDGTGRGYDLALIEAVVEAVSIPVIASGGCGNTEHVREAFTAGNASAVAVAKAIHDDSLTFRTIRQSLSENQIPVRGYR